VPGDTGEMWYWDALNMSAGMAKNYDKLNIFPTTTGVPLL
jgi:hypothetical protein